MKRVLTLLLALSLVFSLVCVLPSVAEFTEITMDEVWKKDGTATADGGYYILRPYGHIGFKEVDLTGAKSIIIKATNNLSDGYDGEWLQIRIDSHSGEMIGYVHIDKHSPTEAIEFKGSLKATEGVHDLYLVSTISTSVRNVRIDSLRLSSEEYKREEYVPVPDSQLIDNHNTTWAMTDDLGRKVADFEEVGPKREGKKVGIFYWTWHHRGVIDKTPVNMSEFAKKYPEAKYDYNHEAWKTAGNRYFWNEPIFGYYSNLDYFVGRKHAEMLANAGVDALFFDATNNAFIWKSSTDVLFKALRDARADGINAPKIVYMTPFSPSSEYGKNSVSRLYLNTYKEGDWSDLWFYWEGKPLVLAYTDWLVPREGDQADYELMEEIKNFFTFRGPQPSYREGQTLPNQWGWLELYPQNGYTKNEDGTFEQVTVGVAANHSYVKKTITAMNDTFVMGRSYTELLGHDKTEGAYKYGYFFTEQLKRALEIDPELMFITGWNEWTASRQESWGGIKNASPDSYDNEGSRDMEPTRGDMKDNYYALLVDAVRKFKGAEPNPVAGAAVTVDLSDISSWEGVTPEFINDKGTYVRNALGVGNVLYENYTQRNNVIKSKVSRDFENLYFLAEAEKDITKPEGDAWMKLYLDVDRNHATGWEGYDYVINCPSVGVISSLNKDGSTNVLGNAEYVLSGKTLAIKVSRESLGIGEVVDLEFKWVDNAKGDILNFYVDGKSAPMGRFNYIYSEKVQKSLSAEERAALSGVTVVRDGSNRAFVNGGKIYTYDPDTRYGATRINGVMYIPTYFLEDALELRTVWEPERLMLKLRGKERLYTTIGTNEIRKNGVALYLSNPAMVIDGIPYIPVTLLSEALGLEIYESGAITAFGKNINKTAVDALINEF